MRGVQVTPGAVEGGMLGSGAVVLWGDVEVTLVPIQFEYQTCWGYAKQAMGSGIWEEMPDITWSRGLVSTMKSVAG